MTIPKWVRGIEYCELVTPRPYKMAMLGLGTSIATPPEGITATAIVVHSTFHFEKEKREEQHLLF